jgi:hypothetical protein
VHVVHESRCPDIGPICAERDEPPQLHDQRFNLIDLRLTAELGVSDHVGIEVQLPLKLDFTTVRYERLDGTPFTPDYPNIHHRNETLFGVGDPWLMGRVAGTAGGFGLSGRLGVALPLGSTEPNPFVLGQMGLAHQHIQLGTGTVSPVLAGEVRRGFGKVDVALHGQAQLMLFENHHGYQAGHRFAFGLRGGYRLTPKVTVSLSTDVLHEQPERWDGVELQDGNLGRTDVLVGAGVVAALGRYSLSGSVKVPVYQDIIQLGHEGGQLDYPAILELTVQRVFDVF